MTVRELIIALERKEAMGYGDKDIFISGNQENFQIDSIQSNRNPGIEPDYLLILISERP